MRGDIDWMIPLEYHPNESVTLLTRQLDQCEVGEVELVVAVPQRHPDERSGAVIHPAVIRAREPAGVAAPARRFRASVAAIVQEGMGHTVLVAGDEHRTANGVANDEVVGTGDLA